MDLTNKKPILISAGIGGWYPAGIDRLERSLIFNGWAGDMMFWKDYPEGCPPHIGSGQYNFKVYCFEKAFNLGYKVVVWADTSFWAIKNPMPLFDYVNQEGIYFFKSGYSLAQTATDALLKYAEVDREALVNIPEFATGLVGINIDNPKGSEFFHQWRQYMDDGMFGGNRNHDTADSNHEMFKFSRQDQSAASMVLYKMGIRTAGDDMDFQSYYGTGMNESKCLFQIGGL